MKSRTLLGLALLAALLAGGTPALAQSGGGFEITWSTVDGGGSAASGGEGYALGSTVGQPDAGALSGEGYRLNGGFWAGVAAAAVEHDLYLPLVLRQA